MVLNNSLTVKFDMNREYILHEVMIGVRKSSQDDKRVTRPSYLDGIEEYMYIPLDGMTAVIVTDSLLSKFDIDASEAWDEARNHLRKRSSIKPMFDVLSGLLGVDHRNDYPSTMYVATVDGVSRGGAVGADIEMLKIFARAHGAKSFVVLPSSIHEMIIVLDVAEDQMSYMSQLVRDVNSTEVEECDRLTDRAYFVRV